MQPPNYYCTWQHMEWLERRGGHPGKTVRDFMCDAFLFGPGGMAEALYPEARGALWFLVDDGWEIPFSHGREEAVWLKPYLGSCLMDEEKFPGYGSNAAERLKTLSGKVRALGWRGLGIWISPTVAYGAGMEGRDEPFEAYWRRRIADSKYAGVAYWKVDWGDYDISDRHRRLLCELKREIYPELFIEHGFVRRPINKRGNETPFCLAAHRRRLAYSDVLRTYDVAYPLSVPITLSRAAALLQYPPRMAPGAAGYINAEDECYLCAALGLAMGVMRSDTKGETTWPDGSPGTKRFMESRPVYRQTGEAIAAVNWQRAAPAFPISQGLNFISKEKLTDRWRFSLDQCYLGLDEKIAAQSAPAVVARNVGEPFVIECDGAQPYICASRNPNGALSIAAFGRVTPARGYFACPAKVTWFAGSVTGPVGVFGHFEELALAFDDDSLADKKVIAVRLVDGLRTDITEECVMESFTLTLTGDMIAKYGRPPDASEPALMLEIGGPADWTAIATPPGSPKRPPGGWLFNLQVSMAAWVHTSAKARAQKKKLQSISSGSTEGSSN